MQTTIEDALARRMLNGEILDGDTVVRRERRQQRTGGRRGPARTGSAMLAGRTAGLSSRACPGSPQVCWLRSRSGARRGWSRW
ncbi:MAG: hypothetical protein R2742_10860 [Micropruina glycogenica]